MVWVSCRNIVVTFGLKFGIWRCNHICTDETRAWVMVLIWFRWYSYITSFEACLPTQLFGKLSSKFVGSFIAFAVTLGNVGRTSSNWNIVRIKIRIVNNIKSWKYLRMSPFSFYHVKIDIRSKLLFYPAFYFARYQSIL